MSLVNSLKQRTILYVEDDELTLRSLSRILSKFFKVVYISRDGKAALRLYKSKQPDFVMTDLSIPLTSGAVLAQKIRDIAPSQLIILTTGYKESIPQDLPINAILYKPLDQELLLETLLSLQKSLAPAEATMEVVNLFRESPVENEELFEGLLHKGNTKIIRIVSPAGFQSQEFSQNDDEWVMLLQGSATLEVDGEAVELTQGDSCQIPAGVPHRVLNTSADPLCIWLAVHVS